MLAEFMLNIPKDILLKVNSLDLNVKSENCNKEINELLKRTVLVGGKRLRPLLTYLMGNLFDLSVEKVTPYARSIELVHASSLAHDDVVDNASTRRGKPSINAVASNQRAVLAGDYLLADVIVELTKAGHLALVKEMAKVIFDLAEGEWLQLDAAGNRNYTREVIESIALKKTASVMSWCTVSPSYLADVSESVREYCRSFGTHLGIAFQQMDDTLDFSGQSKKDYNLDLENGIVNSVTFEWLSLNPDMMERFKSGESIKDILQEANLDKAIEIVENSALRHLDEARNILAIIEKEINPADPKKFKKALKPLEMILDYLAKRKF